MPSIKSDLFKNAYKIKISNESGFAINDWELKAHQSKKFRIGKKSGVAILTGEINDCLILDIDLSDLKDVSACKFIKKFYNSDINNHKGIVQKTPNGYQLFFKYRSDIISRPNLGKHGHMCIRSNDDYVIIAPCVIDGKHYELIKDEPLEQMSDKMFKFIQKMIKKEKKRR